MDYPSCPVLLAAGVAFATCTPTFSHAATPPIDVVYAKLPRFPLIGDPLPLFDATSNRGPIHFPDDYSGKWLILFSHPGDFTPVCTSEFVMLSSVAKELEARNTALLGLSIDDVGRHDAWVKTIHDQIEFKGIRGSTVGFPIIADPEGELAWKLGMVHPHAADHSTVRAVFIVDPKGIIRAMLFYPQEVGRNIDEIKRLVVALQTSDSHKVLMPADWRPGEDALLPKSRAAEANARKAPASVACQAAFFCREPVALERP
jgi:peroxiredoxin 2/4